jgi:hypothetical protein
MSDEVPDADLPSLSEFRFCRNKAFLIKRIIISLRNWLIFHDIYIVSKPTEANQNREDMHTFRLNAGIPSTAYPLGGWEDKSKSNEIVEIMSLCARPNGCLSAFEEDKLDVLEFEENRNVWAPYYKACIHFTCTNRDFYKVCDSERIGWISGKDVMHYHSTRLHLPLLRVLFADVSGFTLCYDLACRSPYRCRGYLLA